MNGHDVEPVIQVFAKGAFADSFEEVLVGRRQDPDVHGHGPVASHFGYFAVIHGLEQLGLDIQADIADFIKKNGPGMGQFEFTDLAAVRAGESSLDVAE